MATLILTTVGTALGGPIGGAIGAALGSRIDRTVLTKGRQGPRLGDLGVQLSSYGSAIPRIFGTMRVAGTVIWSTDLREDVHRTGSAKGGSKATTYSYSASFAVALSGRPIADVGRIWADGKLLRGAGGDWKSETGFRLYAGGEDQPIDPLIASAEGIDATPAHRGIAYALFENLQLADFGNRIPSLTFEVIAETLPVPVAAIVRALSDGAIEGESGETVAGFAASGDSVRGGIEALAAAFPLPIADDGAVLRLAPAGRIAIDAAALGASGTATAAGRRLRERQASTALPDEITIGYYDPARDYQAGLQRARRDGIGLRADAIELAAAITAEAAKGLAEAVLTRAWDAREQATAALPWRWMGIAAGTCVLLDGTVWRVRERTIEHMAVTLKLVRESRASQPIAAAAAGRAMPGGDEAAGATAIALLDLPALDDMLADAPLIYLAAAGTQPGWRRAEASASFDGGASWQAIGRTAAPAVIGSAIGLLGVGPAELFDRRNMVDIRLLHAGMALSGASEALLAAGANAALIGDEIVQFGSAVQTGTLTWRLGDLLRGRRGSDGAIGGHAVGERFILLDPATLLRIDISAARVGGELMVSAIGPGDGGVATIASMPIEGRALRPPSPVALAAVRDPDGAIRITWVRRSRIGWPWLDGADAPIGEDGERYRLTLRTPARILREMTSAAPAYVYPPGEQAADGWAGGALIAGIVQLGTRAVSPATTITSRF